MDISTTAVFRTIDEGKQDHFFQFEFQLKIINFAKVDSSSEI